MHVGVFPRQNLYLVGVPSLPHARGGVSIFQVNQPSREKSSPCTWGCFQITVEENPALYVFPMHVGVFLSNLFGGHDTAVFPMHVGVFPKNGEDHEKQNRLPHARGGVSKYEAKKATWWGSSPCTWGCFSDSSILFCDVPCLPHARGGVSSVLKVFKSVLESSPCTWGCFSLLRQKQNGMDVFPMHVGVFPCWPS